MLRTHGYSAAPFIARPGAEDGPAPSARPEIGGPPIPGVTPTDPIDLTFRGGAVLNKPQVFNIYLGDYWHTPSGSRESFDHDQYAARLLESPYFQMLGQYAVGTGSFGGSTVEASGANASPVDVRQDQIQAIVERQLSTRTLPYDPQGIYTVLLPPGTVLHLDDTSSRDGLGGYHGVFTDRAGQRVHYAAIVDSDGDGNGIDFGDHDRARARALICSHEWVEAATDPNIEPRASNFGSMAWYNDQHGEIADIALDLAYAQGQPLSTITADTPIGPVQMVWVGGQLRSGFEPPPAPPPSPDTAVSAGPPIGPPPAV
jgi:hypothetical protein